MCFHFEFQQVIFFHFIQGPGRTDGQDVIAFSLAFCFVVVVGDEAGFVVVDGSGAVSGEVLDGDGGLGGDHLCALGFDVPGVFEGVVVTGVVVLFGDAAGVGLGKEEGTSGSHHLSPNF